jgi:hypothetical protein
MPRLDVIRADNFSAIAAVIALDDPRHGRRLSKPLLGVRLWNAQRRSTDVLAVILSSRGDTREQILFLC